MRVIFGTWTALPKCEADALYLNLRNRSLLRGSLWPVPLSRHQMTILATVCARGTAPTPDLVEYLYGDDADGGPDDAPNIVGQLVHTLNKKIEPLGLKVRARWGQGYALMDLKE